MDAIKEKLSEFAQAAFGFLRAKKETYESGSRFMRQRVWIFALLGVDVLATLGLVLLLETGDVELVAWYEPGFPANMIILRNESGRALDGVELVLDGKYRLAVERLDRGVNGYEVSRAFRDEQDFGPPDDYRPAVMLLRTRDRVLHLPVNQSKQ